MKKASIVIFGLALTAMAQSVPVILKAPSFPGLRVSRATDPGVQAFVAAVLGTDPASQLVALLPYSLVLDNNTGYSIRAYVLRLTFVDSRGVGGGRNRTYFNFRAVSNGAEIPGGGTQLVTPSSSLRVGPVTGRGWGGRASPSSATETLQVLRSQASIVLSMDLIVFDNGDVIGPDESGALSYLKSWVRLEREMALLVDNRLRAGESPAAISQALQTLINETSNPALGTRELITRAGIARRLDSFTLLPRGDLTAEVQRVLSQPPFQFNR